MNEDNLKLYLPFEKKDSDKHIVEGFASTEQLDSQGEIVKLTAIEKALPDYMKFANIREMHQWSAVGKAVEATIDKSKKGLYLVAKIVDDGAWKKVKEGVYNGFSIGGRILKKMDNEIQELILNEISVVDRPANPGAIFSLVKSESGDLRKDMPIAPMGLFGNPEFKGVFNADKLIQMATLLTMMIQDAQENEQPTKEFDKLLDQLKAVIKDQLDSKKLADLNYTSYFEQLKKTL